MDAVFTGKPLKHFLNIIDKKNNYFYVKSAVEYRFDTVNSNVVNKKFLHRNASIKWLLNLCFQRLGDRGWSHQCGAALLTDDYALSAAHCFFNRSTSIILYITSSYVIRFIIAMKRQTTIEY